MHLNILSDKNVFNPLQKSRYEYVYIVSNVTFIEIKINILFNRTFLLLKCEYKMNLKIY